MGLNGFFRRKSKKCNAETANSSSEVGDSVCTTQEMTMKPTNIAELEQVFKKFDANGDGKISSAELGSILANLGYHTSEEELQKMITDFDADGDGFLGFQEFVALNNGGEEYNQERYTENLKDAFRVYDLDGNGSISAEELHQVMGSIGEMCSVAECRRMISGVDSDGDGKIDFEEFKVMMMMGSRWDSVGSK